MSPRILALAAVFALLSAAPALAGSDPETNAKLGPGDGAGHYLGGQDSTTLWHGCRKSDTQYYPIDFVSGGQTIAPSTHRYVTFTVKEGAFPYFSWKVKSGYKICGAETFAVLSYGGDSLLTWVSYKSGATSGSTATDGKETVKVHMPTKLDTEDNPDLKAFEGQTLTPTDFQAMTVYVKKN
jgi:hypothetical protein